MGTDDRREFERLLDAEGGTDALDEENRIAIALRAAIRESRAEIARGEGVPLDEVLAELDTQPLMSSANAQSRS